MSFRLVTKSVTLNDLERRNSQPPRNFTEFGSFLEGRSQDFSLGVLQLGDKDRRGPKGRERGKGSWGGGSQPPPTS